MDLAPGARGIPRFLPTLTEVVQPGAPLQPTAPGSAAATDPPPEPRTQPHTQALLPDARVAAPLQDEGQLARQALALEARLREQLEQRVRRIVEAALAAQAGRITSQVMGELEPALRQLARENGLPRAAGSSGSDIA